MWTVILTERFENWLNQQSFKIQERVLAHLVRLEHFGPNLARPYVDSIEGSAHSNMKELRVQHSGRAIRIFFAFDPKRRAVVLCGGDKGNDKRFYHNMIRIADQELNHYLAGME
ncbi:type II toxin-antitoxin system RelE/ParE family toxin [Aggregatibacter kilianii]|uniref:type II toxin-antitoxin system RelE/ParE family toxin n=1 Tax=Aggregatibacter kilianii TaxID=2025884 RepID=UPI000D65376A|nr:type II toxin-antitoxin system RelE/ParE family toxin [Aggregatibacter kilianii]